MPALWKAAVSLGSNSQNMVFAPPPRIHDCLFFLHARLSPQRHGTPQPRQQIVATLAAWVTNDAGSVFFASSSSFDAATIRAFGTAGSDAHRSFRSGQRFTVIADYGPRQRSESTTDAFLKRSCLRPETWRFLRRVQRSVDEGDGHAANANNEMASRR